MREQHLADDVALNHELRRTVPDAKVVAAFDQHHLFAVRIVESRDLAFEQLERRGLEIETCGKEAGERAGDSVGLEPIVGVVAHQVGFHHRLRFVGRFHDERHRLLEPKLAKILDASLDRGRLARIHGIAAQQRVGASAQKNQRAESADWPPEPSCEISRSAGHSVMITTGNPNRAESDARASAAERVANAPIRTR